MAKIMVAMSGGVDSSVAAALLNRENSICGGTLRLYEPEGIPSPEVEAAAQVCGILGVPHYVFDMKKEFEEKVINSFALEYDMGLTPNPCIECNKYIKFGGLLDKALELGYDFIATGHYSRIGRQGSRSVIYRPEDVKKDQTYVLWRLSPRQLSHIVMPLGDLSKDRVREIAGDYGFSSAHSKESQDICFVPDGDYAAFLEGRAGQPFKKGEYTDICGNVLGPHLGHQRYTIGQRKGLGIALGRPQFVISKDSFTNRVVLGDEEGLFKTRIYIRQVNMQAMEFPAESFSCTAKLRYSAKDTPCRFHPLGESEAMLEFDAPQRAPSPGQSAVFYDGDVLLGGGKIVRGE